MVFCLHFTCCRSLHVAPILGVMLRFTSNAWIDALKCTIDILLGGISLTSRSQGTCSQCIDIDIYGHEGHEHMVIGMQAGSSCADVNFCRHFYTPSIVSGRSGSLHCRGCEERDQSRSVGKKAQ